jgi:SAM-dependent methyltransferase
MTYAKSTSAMNPSFLLRTSCPVCGGTEARRLLSVPYDDPDLRRAMERLYDEVGHYDHGRVNGAIYELRQCANCRLVYQTQIPGAALMGEIYDTWHDPQKTRTHWLETVNVDRRLEIAREVAVAWNLAARNQAPLRMLDYGCGMGLWAEMAKAFGAEVWGVEFSASRRAHCASLGLRMCDPSDLPADHFDYIHLDQVLEHLVSPGSLLRNLGTLLRPGGILCVAVPRGVGIPRALSKWRREFSRPALGRLVAVVPLLHLNCFTQPNLRLLAESCGLTHLRPPWAALQPLWGCASGMRGKLRAFARPFFLRSPWATRLYFRRPER